MRRLSLALALLGAVSAVGCGSPASSQSGGAKGVADGTFTVTVQNGQGQTRDPVTGVLPLELLGGKVTSSPAGIDCGEGVVTQKCSADFALGTTVVLTAAPIAPKLFLGWAGSCSGEGTCSLAGNADKYILAMFATERTGHPNFSDPAVHAQQYLDLTEAKAGALDCTSCHGANLLGQGIALSCATCHGWPMGKHFTASGHNSGTCARCHAGDGFRDFIGADGSASAVLTVGYTSTAVAATDITVACSATVTTNCLNPGMQCNMCHNSATVLGGGTLNQHKFPSGNIVTMDGKTAICSQCHDGGRPGYEVSQLAVQIKAVAADVQLPTADNKVVRAHYVPAASTLFGEEAANWFQYAGAAYTARNEHGGKASCTSCHNAHTGELPGDLEIAAKCGGCHFNEAGAPVASFLELEDSRQFGFEGDIDGNAVQESIKDEIAGLGAKMYAALQAYATNVAGANICAISNRFYIQVNTTDACAAGANNVAYNKFTPRLLRAGYNYLIYQNDAGAWAHNPRYVIEVLYDTIADLNVGLGTNFAPNGLRAFNGHFGAAEDPSKYAAMIYHGAVNALSGEVLPPMGFTSAACYQCHGGNGGFSAYVATAPAPLAAAVIADANKVTAIQCSTCHTFDGADMKGLRSDIPTLYFPPQKGATQTPTANVVTYAAADLPKSFAVCGTCHSGRENGTTVANKVNGVADTSFTLTFTNPHYLGAAAMILGTEVKALFEYPTQTYAGKTVFWKTGTNGNAPGPYGSAHGAECTGCHQPKGSKHTFEVDFDYCATCHKVVASGDHRLAPIEEEYQVRTAELLAAIQTYATANAPTGICYNAAANPYFFVHTGSGACLSTEKTSFATFNPKLLEAAYNYQWTQKEPGAWAHNEVYVTQSIYDSIVDLGGTPTFTRP